MTHKTSTTSTHGSTRHFIRHYVEMIAVMFLGMIVLGVPAGWLFKAFGTSWAALSPAIMLFAMAVTMTMPMVAWMRYRGHSWRLNLEMAASMFIPAFAAMALVGAGVTAGMGALMVVEHVAMLASMLAAMLLRRDEYSGAHAHATVQHGFAT